MAPNDGSFNWPTPRKGPDIPYKNETSSNPILRGYTLMAATALIKSSSLVQGLLWKLNGLDKLKDVPSIKSYDPRYDPTVIPAATRTEDLETIDMPIPSTRQGGTDYYTIGDYHRAFLSGKVTPSDVVEYLIPLIDRNAKPVSKYAVAFLSSRVDLVRAAAKASTDRYRNRKPLGILDGVPIAVKDEIDVAGYSKSLGSIADFTSHINETGWCVRQWELAGAIIIGKTNMHEVGLDTTGNNPSKGTPLNPHNDEYYCGGSSSGSAMAVAAGLCPFAHGADGGGSIRLPASFCGIYGLKPSHGRVSGRPIPDLACSVGVHGPMASDLESLIIAYRIMAQPDDHSMTSRSFVSPMIQSKSDTKKSDKILGICRDWVSRSDPDVLGMFNDAISYYSKTQGYKVVDIDIPLLPEGQKAHALTILNEVRGGLSSVQMSQLSYPNQLLLTVAGTHATTQDFLAAQKIRSVIMEHLSWLWEQYPGMLILTPTTPCAGSRIKHPSDVTSGYGVSDGDMSLRSMEYVFLANWAGCPALTRPMGFAPGNVPVGLMAMGEWGSEEDLFLWARDGDSMTEDIGNYVSVPKLPGNWVDVLKGAK